MGMVIGDNIFLAKQVTPSHVTPCRILLNNEEFFSLLRSIVASGGMTRPLEETTTQHLNTTSKLCNY